MYERHMIDRGDIQTVIEDGIGVGFIVKTRIPYYRGVSLSLIEDVQVRFDNHMFTKDQLHFTVGGCTYSFDEMETMATLRWEFGEKATIFVPLKGGFPLGGHSVEVMIALRISYMGGVRPFSLVLENVSPMGG